MDCLSMQCLLLISTLLCPISLSSTPFGWVDADCCLSRELLDIFLASGCLTVVCVVPNQLITCCQRARSVDCISKMSLAQKLWAEKIAEQWKIKTNKVIAVWPVLYVEQSPNQKVSPLTMETWGVKSSLSLKMQVRQSPIFKHIYFHRSLFVWRILIFS